MEWSFKINILGADEQGRLLITLAEGNDHIVQGKVNGKLTELNIVNQIDRDVEGNEVERIISWNGKLPIVNYSHFYSAHSFRFEAESQEYKY